MRSLGGRDHWGLFITVESKPMKAKVELSIAVPDGVVITQRVVSQPGVLSGRLSPAAKIREGPIEPSRDRRASCAPCGLNGPVNARVPCSCDPKTLGRPHHNTNMSKPWAHRSTGSLVGLEPFKCSKLPSVPAGPPGDLPPASQWCMCSSGCRSTFACRPSLCAGKMHLRATNCSRRAHSDVPALQQKSRAPQACRTTDASLRS